MFSFVHLGIGNMPLSWNVQRGYMTKLENIQVLHTSMDPNEVKLPDIDALI